MADGPTSGESPRPSLLRDLGVVSIMALAVNGVVGSGIFVLPANVARILGPASPVGYLAAAFATLLIVLCFAEAASRLEQAGGPYVYARAAFGPFVGFQMGWLVVLARVSSTAAIVNATVSYLGTLWSPLGAGMGRVTVVIVALSLLAAANVAGVRQGKWVVNLLTAGKLLPLLALIAIGLGDIDTSNPSGPLTPPSAAAVREAAVLLIFAFAGYESASIPSDEMINPRRDLPVALVAAVLVTTVLYILIQVVVQAAVPDLAASATPLAAAGRTLMGPAGATLITVGAVVSTVGTCGTNMLVTPRMLHALAGDGLLPSAFGRVHPRFRTPHVAVAVFYVASTVAALSSHFTALATASALSRLVYYAATSAAVPVLRRRGTGAGGFRIPGGLLIPVLSTAVCLWLLSACTARQLVAGTAALGVGTALYAVARGARRPR